MSPDEFRAALLALHWSQRGLAEILKTHATTVRRWATGEQHVPDSVEQWLKLLMRTVVETPPPIGSDTSEFGIEDNEFSIVIVPKYTEALIGWIKRVAKDSGLSISMQSPLSTDTIVRIIDPSGRRIDLCHPEIDSNGRTAIFWLRCGENEVHHSCCVILRPEGASLVWYEWALRTTNEANGKTMQDQVCDYFMPPKERREKLLVFLRKAMIEVV